MGGDGCVDSMWPICGVPAVSYYAYYGKKLDPEPWRCRRTDGKKWRCSKEAHPDSKYCERHMHRGRNRSRKPVESKTASPAHPSQPQLSTVTTTTRETAPLDSLTVGGKTHGLSLGGAGSSQLHVDASNAHYRYGSKYGYTQPPLSALIIAIQNCSLNRFDKVASFGCKLYWNTATDLGFLAWLDGFRVTNISFVLEQLLLLMPCFPLVLCAVIAKVQKHIFHSVLAVLALLLLYINLL